MLKLKMISKQINLLIVLGTAIILASNYKHSTSLINNHFQPVAIIDTDKFSIALPAGWKHYSKVSNGFKILFLTAPTVDNFNPNLNILTESTGDASMDDYAKASMDNMKKSNMKVIGGSAAFTSNGTQGKCFTSTLDYQGRTIALKSYLFIKNGVGYVITGTCLTSQIATYRPVFDATVKTFKLK